MKRLSLFLAAFATLLSLFAFAPPADAHGRVRGSVFLHFGAPWPIWWGPRYYYPSYYYDDYYYPPPAVYVERPEPPTYIERSDVDSTLSSAAAPQQNWWYWCPSSQKYYPYVKECPGGFHRVAPQAPPAGK